MGEGGRGWGERAGRRVSPNIISPVSAVDKFYWLSNKRVYCPFF